MGHQRAHTPFMGRKEGPQGVHPPFKGQGAHVPSNGQRRMCVPSDGQQSVHMLSEDQRRACVPSEHPQVPAPGFAGRFSVYVHCLDTHMAHQMLTQAPISQVNRQHTHDYGLRIWM
jgi:hypothetical protein